MIRYIFSRLAIAAPTLLAVVTLSFFLLRAAPGGPFDSTRALPPEIEANLNALYGLDRPLTEQFISYVGGVLRGDFGPSYRYRDVQVSDIVADALPVSLAIGGLGLSVTLILGIGAGAASALVRGPALATTLSVAISVGISVPSFVSAPILALIFGVMLDILPVAGWGGGRAEHLILPMIVLGVPNAAFVARLMRASMLEQMTSESVLAARARGASSRRIILRHILQPALIPVVSYLGPASASILTRSVVIEQLFALPGAGQAFIDASLNRDYTLVLGLVIVFATLVILLNLLTDILAGALNPRLRAGQ